MQNYLGVTMAAEHAALTLEFRAKSLEVVDLAVEDNLQRSLVHRHRLMSGWRQVDDREPAVSQSDARSRVDAMVVGSTVAKRRRHALETGLQVALRRRTIGYQEAGNPTHGQCTAGLRRKKRPLITRSVSRGVSR